MSWMHQKIKIQSIKVYIESRFFLKSIQKILSGSIPLNRPFCLGSFTCFNEFIKGFKESNISPGFFISWIHSIFNVGIGQSDSQFYRLIKYFFCLFLYSSILLLISSWKFFGSFSELGLTHCFLALQYFGFIRSPVWWLSFSLIGDPHNDVFFTLRIYPSWSQVKVYIC